MGEGVQGSGQSTWAVFLPGSSGIPDSASHLSGETRTETPHTFFCYHDLNVAVAFLRNETDGIDGDPVAPFQRSPPLRP